VKRFLLIAMIGGMIVPIIAVTVLIKFTLTFPFFIGIIIVGYFITFLTLRKFPRFEDSVIVNNDFLKLGNKYTLNWDSLISYQYDESLLFAGFIFRTETSNYRLTGLLKGSEGEKFKQLKENIIEIFENRNLTTNKKKIEYKNFFSSKWAKLVGIVNIVVLLALTGWIILEINHIKTGTILKLLILYLISFTLLKRIFIDKK